MSIIPINRCLITLATLLLATAAGMAQSADTGMRGNLPEVVVRDRYKADSLARRLTYQKAFHDAEIRTKVYFRPGGIVFDRLFSDIAMTVSGKKKKVRAFRRQFLKDEAERASWRYYSVGMVMSVTGLDSSEAYRFRLVHPMPKDAYEGASQLEMLQWIRNAWRSDR